MQMHSSEFLKYAYELGAAQALADLEKDAGFRELINAAKGGIEHTLHNPTLVRGSHAFAKGVGAAPTGVGSALIGGGLGVAGEFLPKQQNLFSLANIAF